MPRVDVPNQTIPRNGSIANIVFVAADAANDHDYFSEGRTLLLVENDAVGSNTVDIKGRTDVNGRTGDDQLVVPANSIGISGPKKNSLFASRTANGKIDVDITVDTTLFFAALRYTEPNQ